jgi:hypothetical protein
MKGMILSQVTSNIEIESAHRKGIFKKKFPKSIEYLKVITTKLK